jgi:hypothetical protein
VGKNEDGTERRWEGKKVEKKEDEKKEDEKGRMWERKLLV